MFIFVDPLFARLAAQARQSAALPVPVRFVPVDLDRTWIAAPPAPQDGLPASAPATKA